MEDDQESTLELLARHSGIEDGSLEGNEESGATNISTNSYGHIHLKSDIFYLFVTFWPFFSKHVPHLHYERMKKINITMVNMKSAALKQIKSRHI